jgi:hypothetical protein
MSDASATPRAELKVINQDATDEEVAALVAVISSLQAPAPVEPPRRSEWSANARTMRPVLRRGPGAWRASGLPR